MQESIFFQAMIYLASAVIMVPIAKKLSLGSVLGYLLAGILIGPSGLSFIDTEGQDLMHFAEFGVVMLLFIIGLELNPLRLWRMRTAIAGLGGLQLLFTGMIVFIACLLIGLQWKQALALALIIPMFSTAIVLQSLSEKGLMKSVAGESSFAVLLFQDIAVIPILALFPLLSDRISPMPSDTGNYYSGVISELPAWLQTLSVFGAVILVIITGRYLVRPIYRIIAKTGLREMFTATSLLLVVATGVLMTFVGLSPALGAFLAGVLLANSEYRHELESDIDPFKGLLLGLFFISVGASIQFAIIISNPWMVLGIVVGIMFIKIGVMLLIGRIFKLHIAQNFTFSLGLSQVGEFAFILLGASSQVGILTLEISNLMIAVVAMSMAFTPLFLIINDKFIQPRLFPNVSDVDEREPDVAARNNPVIIAGYGHFGNTIGRFLQANQVNATVLDNDSDNVDLLRRMGFKVFYGDASRQDLLKIAGAENAKLIIIAISSVAKRLEMIEIIKKHFPNLQMLVRANNRDDAYALMNAGILHIYRETLDTSLRVGVDAMRMLGFRAHEATRLAKIFIQEDEKRLKYLSSIKNQEEYILAVREHTRELEINLEADRKLEQKKFDEGWDESMMRNDNAG